MTFPYKGSNITLHGTLPEAPAGTVVQVCSVEVYVSESDVTVSWPHEIQQLINEFSVLFEIPTELPPVRDCDHAIPLVPGAAPVQVRPYRYAPALKTEIENQIKEML